MSCQIVNFYDLFCSIDEFLHVARGATKESCYFGLAHGSTHVLKLTVDVILKEVLLLDVAVYLIQIVHEGTVSLSILMD